MLSPAVVELVNCSTVPPPKIIGVSRTLLTETFIDAAYCVGVSLKKLIGLDDVDESSILSRGHNISGLLFNISLLYDTNPPTITLFDYIILIKLDSLNITCSSRTG